MRTYQDINKPTIGDIIQAMEAESDQGGLGRDILPLIKDRFTFPTLYTVMDYLEDQAVDRDRITELFL